MTAALPLRSNSTTAGYISVETPRPSTIQVKQTNQQSHIPVANGTHYAFLANIAQFVVLAAICVFTFGQIAMLTPIYSQNLKVVISGWWGVPKEQALMAHGGGHGPQIGHSEMVRPTYVLLFFVLPLLVSLVLVEFLRKLNVRRITSRYILHIARVLRRKPIIMGQITPLGYGELLFLVFLIGGNILVFYYGISQRITQGKVFAAKKHQSLIFNDYLDVVSVTLGFNCTYNLAFLFLPATRNSVWMEFLNISYANSIKYHRYFGVITVLTGLSHGSSFTWLWIRKGIWTDEALPCFDCPMDSEKGERVWLNVFGELALLCFLTIGVTSIPWMRRHTYNLFYYTHHLFILAVIFAVMHFGPIVWWIFPTFTFYVFHRAISSSNAFAPTHIKEITPLAGNNILKLVIVRSSSLHSGQDYKVGQFVYLNVPAVSKLQWHPFTIASSPHTSENTLIVYVKVLGDWTQKLLACKQTDVLPIVYMDGFYGVSLELYQEYSTVCLIGGGIGITPLLAVLDDMVAKLSHSSAEPRQQVFLIFAFRELALLEELHPLLAKIHEFDPHEQFFHFHFTLTQEPDNAILDHPIDHNRENHVFLTPYAIDKTKRTPHAFLEPLRLKSGFHVLAGVTMCSLCFVVVAILEYGGGKIERNGRYHLWSLQQFAEIFTLFAGGLVVYLFIWAENTLTNERKKVAGATSRDVNEKVDFHLRANHAVMSARSSVFSSTVQPTTDFHTFRDLVSEYKVTVGRRPDIAAILKQVYEQHHLRSIQDNIPNAATTSISVFLSGPQALVSATESAIAFIDTSAFDIHEEEFEL